MLAHLDDFGRVHDLQQVLDAGQITLLAQRAADFGFSADELDLVAPRPCGAHGSRDWSRRRVISAHRIERDSDHTLTALFPNTNGFAG